MASRTVRRHALRAFAAVAVGATVAAVAVPGTPGTRTTRSVAERPGSPTAVPATFGLDAEPRALLPETVSTQQPVTIVSTTRDDAGRPVVSTRTTADPAEAERLVRAGQRAPRAVGVQVDARAVASAVDPLAGQQWDMSKLQAQTAWGLSTGSGVTVAVVDSGVDAAHPDLAGVVLPGIDLVDDGGDGRIDPNGHGTHVAGTVAALTGNGVGVVGLARDAKVLPVRVLGADGLGHMSDVATGIVWATDNGARVVNMSLGSAGQSYAVTQAVAYARGKGVVVVAAAGNERQSGSPVSWPAADNGVVAVAATDPDDDYAYYSNAGGYVDLAAPGSQILSTTGGGYEYFNGTSMAAPHVAALAAMMQARNASLTPDEIEQLMVSSALDLGPTGRDNNYGHGRIRPVAALHLATPATTSPSPASPSTPASPEPTTPAPTSPGPSTPPAEEPLPTPVVQSPAWSRTVGYGSSVLTEFTVLAGGQPWSGRPVQVCIAEGGTAPFSCAATTTLAGGVVRHQRKATGTYRVRLLVPATAESNAASSATYTYTVRAVPTLRRVSSYSVSATVAGPAGQATSLQRYAGGRWTTVTRFPAGGTLTVTGLRAGYPYRLSVEPTARVAGATSGTVRL